MTKAHLEPYQFRPGESGNPKGRPKKIYTLIKEKGFGKDDIKIAFEELFFHSDSELSEIREDKTKPMILRIVAKQIQNAFNKGDWTKIKEIMERVLGKEIALKHSGEIDTGESIGMYEYFIGNQNGSAAAFEQEADKGASDDGND